MSSSANVDVGELYPMGITVRDPDTSPLNAQVVTLTITQPDMVVITPPIANPPGIVGQYSCDFIPMQAGHHDYVWRTQVPTLVLQGSFEVWPIGAGGILSLPKAKTLVRIDADDYEQDDELRSVILAVTAVVEDEVKRVVVRRSIVEDQYVRRSTTRLLLGQGPALSVDSVTDRAGTIMGPLIPRTTGIVVLPRQVSGDVEVVYTAGMSVIPPNFVEAAGYILQHIWTNRMGSAQRPRIGGSTDDDNAPSTVSYSIPNRAKDLLGRPGVMIG